MEVNYLLVGLWNGLSCDQGLCGRKCEHVCGRDVSACVQSVSELVHVLPSVETKERKELAPKGFLY